mmetsp:Transcript_23549/g.51439  ORF Transcript_23549/g.51439 Transcript_23549/m.51439 type:complete len:157 (+) Transcript_23549:25-495(+)
MALAARPEDRHNTSQAKAALFAVVQEQLDDMADALDLPKDQEEGLNGRNYRTLAGHAEDRQQETCAVGGAKAPSSLGSSDFYRGVARLLEIPFPFLRIRHIQDARDSVDLTLHVAARTMAARQEARPVLPCPTDRKRSVDDCPNLRLNNSKDVYKQ